MLGRVSRLILVVAVLLGLTSVIQPTGPAHATLASGWTNVIGDLDVLGSGNVAQARSIAIGGGKIVVVGQEINPATSSSDLGKNNIWVSDVSPVSFQGYAIGGASGVFFHSVGYGNGTFLAIGSSAANNSAPVVYSSTDGVTWTNRTNNVDFAVNQSSRREFGWTPDIGSDAVMFDGSEFVVLGQAGDAWTWPTGMSGIARTSNGQQWSAPQYPYPANGAFLSTGYLNRTPSSPSAGRTFAKNGSTIVFGAGPQGGSLTSLNVSTDNGATWKFGYDTDGTDADGTVNPFSVDGVVADGNTLMAPSYQVVGFGNGKFVGLQSDYSSFTTTGVATSTDGLAWTVFPNALGQNPVTPYEVAFTGSEFVLLADAGIFTSANGQSWTLTFPLSSSYNSGIIFPFDFEQSNGLSLVSAADYDPATSTQSPMLLLNGSYSPPTTTTTTTTVAPTTTAAPANVPTLVNSSNQSQLTRQPGSATALVNGQPVAPVVETPADLPAAKVDPEDRSPAQVQSLQAAADALVNQLNQSAGGNSGLTVVDTPTGANLTGLLSVPVPIENTVLVEVANNSTLFAALNQDGSVTEVQPGAVIEVLGNGQVGVLASGLTPGETVEFVVMSTPTLLGSYTVAANGSIKAQTALPSGIGLGNHTLVVASPTVQASLGLKVTVGALPATGVDSSRGPISVALWLLAGGAFVAVLRRRRLIVD